MHTMLTKAQILGYLRKKRVHCLQISLSTILKKLHLKFFFKTTK